MCHIYFLINYANTAGVNCFNAQAGYDVQYKEWIAFLNFNCWTSFVRQIITLFYFILSLLRLTFYDQWESSISFHSLILTQSVICLPSHNFTQTCIFLYYSFSPWPSTVYFVISPLFKFKFLHFQHYFIAIIWFHLLSCTLYGVFEYPYKQYAIIILSD